MSPKPPTPPDGGVIFGGGFIDTPPSGLAYSGHWQLSLLLARERSASRAPRESAS